MKPHRGTLILVLGILSIVVCGPFTGIPAWIMAANDLKEMDAETMDPSGRGQTQAGKICGIIGIIWSIVITVISVLIVMGVLAAAAHGH